VSKSERNVNLDHHIPSASLLSYVDYNKVPKSEEAQLHKKDNLEYRDFLPDDSGLSIWERLRKPEFQRATNSWEDDKILNLIRTLRANQVIPGVILWLNTKTGHIFVLDGAHRLSVIRAWIVNDWGDSKAALEYGFVEDIEVEAACRIRARIEEEIGSYQSSIDAGKRFKKLVDESKNPSDYLDLKTEALGKFMYNLNTAFRIPIQWVTGDYRTAEDSFININTGGTPLSDQEVLFLKKRRSPVARAISGIAANGTKPTLWLKYKDECDKLSRDLYSIMLAPSDSALPERVADYPLCRSEKQKNFERYLFLQNIFSISMFGETGEDKLDKVLAEYADEEDNNLVADKTIEALQRSKQMISHVHGNLSQSLGLYPAFYFYTNKGLYKDLLLFLFLAWFSVGSTEEILHRKIKFSMARDLFEEVWMIGKDSLVQYFGRKGAGPSRITNKHVETIGQLIDFTFEAKEKSLSSFDVLDNFLKDIDPKVYADFLKQYKQERGKPFGRFSEATKLHSEFLSLFYNGTPCCSLCGGRVLLGSHQIDHRQKRSKGGTNSYKNAEPVHPFCNNHKDKLEGLRKSSANYNVLQQIGFQVPRSKTSSTAITQLDLGFPNVN